MFIPVNNIYLKLVVDMLEEIKNNIIAISVFLSGLFWIAYKLKLVNYGLQLYRNRINDRYGIVIPSILTLLLPFIFQAFSNQTIPDIFKFILPVLTFYLGQITISYQKNRERDEQNKKIYLSIVHEIIENIKIIGKNNSLLDQEISIIEKNQYLITPIYSLKNESLNLILKLSPETLIRNDLMIAISDVIYLTKETNELIESRSNFMASLRTLIVLNGFDNYSSDLKKYDQNILTNIISLKSMFENILPKIIMFDEIK